MNWQISIKLQGQGLVQAPQPNAEREEEQKSVITMVSSCYLTQKVSENNGQLCFYGSRLDQLYFFVMTPHPTKTIIKN